MSPSPFWTCEPCGALNIRSRPTCDACGVSRQSNDPSSPDRTDAIPAKRCVDCSGTFRFWTELTQGEDGNRRCASCHFRYLGRRAAGTTDHTVCTELGCTKTVAEHRAELHAILARSWLAPALRTMP